MFLHIVLYVNRYYITEPTISWWYVSTTSASSRSTNPCLCRNTGLTTSGSGPVPFRGHYACILSMSHHMPIAGWGQAAKSKLPQRPSANKRVPRSIISPPCQGSCNRRYLYACHASKGLGRGAPEGKEYADDLSMPWFRWSVYYIYRWHPGVTRGAPPTNPEQASGLIPQYIARYAYPAASYGSQRLLWCI